MDNDLIRAIPGHIPASTNDLTGRLKTQDRFAVLAAANNGGRPISNTVRPPTSGGARLVVPDQRAQINFYN
jgi:hypothetical protein